MRHIAIVGCGLSGRLLALNLLEHASSAVTIHMLDRESADAMGPAYSSEAAYLLLNVPAGRMGAYPEDPGHFLKWAQLKGVPADELSFLPRKLYREYVFALLREAAQRTRGAVVAPVQHEVVDLEIGGGGVTLHLGSKPPLVVDKVVLALGNCPPRHPPIKNRAAVQSRRYVQNPWVPAALDSLARSGTVLLIGTGQTTVDLVVALRERRHEGRIVAISRHGILPLAHRGFDTYPSFYGEIKNTPRIRDIFRTVRKHVRNAESMGLDVRAVVDSLRPDTQALWLALPDEEKRRFIRLAFRYWEIVRSRIPPQSEAIINQLRASGQLQIVAGRISDFVETGQGLEVHYSARRGAKNEVERADLVVNCIGPEMDYARVDQPLVRNLLRRGLMRPGPARLGIDATPNGSILGADGALSDVLYTLGSPMKGVLWEVIAAPEIRVQAERLARRLLE